MCSFKKHRFICIFFDEKQPPPLVMKQLSPRLRLSPSGAVQHSFRRPHRIDCNQEITKQWWSVTSFSSQRKRERERGALSGIRHPKAAFAHPLCFGPSTERGAGRPAEQPPSRIKTMESAKSLASWDLNCVAYTIGKTQQISTDQVSIIFCI